MQKSCGAIAAEFGFHEVLQAPAFAGAMVSSSYASGSVLMDFLTESNGWV